VINDEFKAPVPAKRRSPPPLSVMFAPQLAGQITPALDLAASP